MERFFADRRCWLIFRLMESMFMETGTISLGVLAGEHDREGVQDDGSDHLDFLGGIAFFDFIAQCDCPERNYEEWRENQMSRVRFDCGNLPISDDFRKIT
jgi:hypothetical protein